MVNAEAHTVRGITQKSSLLNWRFWTQKVWDALKIDEYIFEKVENQEWYFFEGAKEMLCACYCFKNTLYTFPGPQLGDWVPHGGHRASDLAFLPSLGVKAMGQEGWSLAGFPRPS